VVCLLLPSIQRYCAGAQRARRPKAGSGAAVVEAEEGGPMYSILYIIGAIVVIVVVLKLLGLF
jgi:hypothetical protein